MFLVRSLAVRLTVLFLHTAKILEEINDDDDDDDDDELVYYFLHNIYEMIQNMWPVVVNRI